MIGKAKEGWQHYQRFKRFEPGHRFQTRYHRRRRCTEQGQTSKYGRTFNLVGWLVLIVAGFVFLPTPGPSYIIIVLGLWMLAGEFLVLARFFDRAEVSLRKLSSTSSFSERRVSRTHPARVMRLSPFSVLLP
jgi:hypothetical protein